MKRISLMIVAGLMSATIAWGAGINYNGTSLTENNEFTRTECGTSSKNVMKEVSGKKDVQPKVLLPVTMPVH